MVQSAVEQLKSDAFKLSKILATYKVKLSSQQCLDVMSRLRWNQPYEAVLAKLPHDASEARHVAERERQTLHEWLACATSFCELARTLDCEGVNWAVFDGGKKLDLGLYEDGKEYLRSAGVAAERFSRTAEVFVQSRESGLYQGLKFTVEASEPICETELAILRIQSFSPAGCEHFSRSRFVPLGLKQRRCDRVMFGAEARIALRTAAIPDFGDKPHPYQLRPCVELTYEVAGQAALKVFATVLQGSRVQPLWEATGGFDVETRIYLTKPHDQGRDWIEGDWVTADDPDGNRLLSFCLAASRLSDEETQDWPPYMRLGITLDSRNTQEDLERYFAALCAHTLCFRGDSGGW